MTNTVQKIEYKSGLASDNVDMFKNVAKDEKIAVPSSVMSSLNEVIKQHQEEAKQYEHEDGQRASFALTVAAALEQVKEELSRGTVAGVEAAALQMSGFMSPMTSLIPSDVVRFVYKRGQSTPLKTYFDQQ